MRPMYYSHSSVNDLQSILNSDFKNVTSWKENHLTLNVSKSKFMLIGSSKRLAVIFSYVIISFICESNNV